MSIHHWYRMEYLLILGDQMMLAVSLMEYSVGGHTEYLYPPHKGRRQNV